MYAAEGEASGQITAAVSVSCIRNTNNIDNQKMIDMFKAGLEKYNQENNTDRMGGLQNIQFNYQKR